MGIHWNGKFFGLVFYILPQTSDGIPHREYGTNKTEIHFSLPGRKLKFKSSLGVATVEQHVQESLEEFSICH